MLTTRFYRLGYIDPVKPLRGSCQLAPKKYHYESMGYGLVGGGLGVSKGLSKGLNGQE